MVKAAVHIGLIGCGSRGLSICERLLNIAQDRPEQPIILNIFDSNVLGSGIHAPDQPDYLLLNTIAGQLGVFPDAVAFGSLENARARKGPDFLTWCRAKSIKINPQNGLVSAVGRSVEPEDFLPRRLLGSYLADALSQILSTAPKWVTIHLHHHRVVAVRTGDKGSFVLELPSGEVVSVDRLILTVGHTSKVLPVEVGRIHNVYPLPDSLDSIKAGECVLIEGLGLGAMDTLAALTVGRGGVFEKMADASHIYIPSGAEPTVYIQSLNGLPFRARPNGLMQFPRHQAIFITSARIDFLRTQTLNGQLDFERDILPLMLLEMRAAAVAVLHARSNVAGHHEVLARLGEAAAQRLTDTYAAEALLCQYEKISGAIDAHALIGKTLPASVNAQNYHAWIYAEIEKDQQEARLGLCASATKAAIEVWRDLRDHLRQAVDFEGLTKASHRQFYGQWHTVINRLVAGPQKERHADLLALSDAGLLTFLHPSSTPVTTPYRRIAGYLQNAGLTQSTCAPIRDLAGLGLIRPRSDEPGMDGIDINAANHPVSIDGEVVRNIWVLGPLAEGACYYNHYVASAGAPSRLFIDAHKVANAILEEEDPA